jgi:hypothetical protein
VIPVSRRLICPALPYLSTVAIALMLAGSPAAFGALAAVSPYGEASHFGGFDASGTVGGEFNLPVGFAVDGDDSSNSDGNSVYVLDRVVLERGEGEEKLGYRLQKLSSAGAVLGSVTLPVQTFTDTENYSDANPLISLAVDSSKHRVYALVQAIVESGEGFNVPVAQRVVAWSTIPSAGQLVAAPGYPVDSLTGAGLVAGASVLEPGGSSSDLYVPEGLAVAADHDVVVEAQQGGSNGIGGQTILQSVVTETVGGKTAGDLDGSWVANSTIAPNTEQADGIFNTPTGFGVDLYEHWGQPSSLVEVNSAFTQATPLTPQTPSRDTALSIDNPFTVNDNSTGGGALHGASDLRAYTAASPITQLSNGLYAARFGQASSSDLQSNPEPWGGLPSFWVQGNPEASDVANMGVRLFSANGTIVTTIGGQPQGQACNLDDEQLSVAAGAKGSLFILTQPNTANGNSDDEVIEYTPGGKGACPAPTGSLTVNGQSGSSFSFPVGTQVTLADTVNREGEAPYRFDWVLLNAGTLATEDLNTQMLAPGYEWPAPSTTHTFAKKGTYFVAATLYGDYGVSYIGTAKITIH